MEEKIELSQTEKFLNFSMFLVTLLVMIYLGLEIFGISFSLGYFDYIIGSTMILIYLYGLFKDWQKLKDIKALIKKDWFHLFGIYIVLDIIMKLI